jgi:hypothetical protein
MVLLNVVCFGLEQKMMHKHVTSARDAGRLADSGKFRLEWYDRPRPGMLERPSLITYVSSHGGEWFGGTSGLWVHPVGGSFDEFGTVGGEAVVLDACDTASKRWLYDRGSLRAECRSLKGKPLLGGSGNAQPNEIHGKKILDALIDVLAEVEDTVMTDPEELPTLLARVRDRAARKAAHSSKLKTAYSIRIVGETPMPAL